MSLIDREPPSIGSFLDTYPSAIRDADGPVIPPFPSFRSFVTGLRQNDQSAAAVALVSQYSRPVWLFAARRLGPNHSDIDDIVIATFVNTLRQAATFMDEAVEQEKGLKNLIFRIAYRETINTVRRGRRESRKSIGDDYDLLDPSATNRIEQVQQRVDIMEAFKDLSPKQQGIIRLQFFGSHTQQEISDELHIPLGTVKTRSRLGREHMRELLAA